MHPTICRALRCIRTEKALERLVVLRACAGVFCVPLYAVKNAHFWSMGIESLRQALRVGVDRFRKECQFEAYKSHRRAFGGNLKHDAISSLQFVTIGSGASYANG